jgi:hypothetical protein
VRCQATHLPVRSGNAPGFAISASDRVHSKKKIRL